MDFDPGEIFESLDNDIDIIEIWKSNEIDVNYWFLQKILCFNEESRILDLNPKLESKFFSHCKYETSLLSIPLNIKSESFDVVLCNEIIENNPQPLLVIEEITRVLKRGGKILISTPFASKLKSEIFYCGFTPEWFNYCSNRFGLKIIEITQNGGFFKFMSQQSHLISKIIEYAHLDPNEYGEIWKLFSRDIPKYLLKLEKRFKVDILTVGYFVEMEKI